MELGLPQAVFPQTSFDVWCSVPTRRTNAQVRSDGTVGPLQVGRVLVFPPSGAITPTEGWTIWPETPSIWWNGPIRSQDHASEVMAFKTTESIPGTYSVYLGANRGRGQIYPSGLASNLAPLRSPVDGVITGLTWQAKRYGTNLWVRCSDGVHLLHLSPGTLVAEVMPRSYLRSDESLVYSRNLGGFGVAEQSMTFQTRQHLVTEIRILGLLLGTQVALVLKKKQFERLKL